MTAVSSTARTEAFSDGVFAIAITLLILTIGPPKPGDLGGRPLWLVLLEHWPSYLAYLTAFLAIGVTWMNHHAVFAKLARVDATIQWTNLLLLLAVSFASFPTALLANFLPTGLFSASSRTAAFVFVVVWGCRPAIWVLIWRHLLRHPGLLEPGVTPAHARSEVRRAAGGALAYAASAVVALLVPIAAVVLSLVLASFYAVTAHGLRGHDAPSPDPTHGEV